MNQEMFCPCCDTVLYRLRTSSSKPFLSEYVDSVPVVSYAEGGAFMTCFSCINVVKMERRLLLSGIDVFRPATDQPFFA